MVFKEILECIKAVFIKIKKEIKTMINNDNIRVQWTIPKTTEDIMKIEHEEYIKYVEKMNYNEFYKYVITKGLQWVLQEIKEYKALGMTKNEIKAE